MDNLEMREAKGEEDRVDLLFLKVVLCFSLGMGVGMSMPIVIARWSEILRLRLERWCTMRPNEQTRSRV